jgi:hypothetical protein
MKLRALFLACAVGFGLPLAASAASPSPVANPADVRSLDGIIAALYDVISGPAGAPRDWGRFQSLFAPGARMTAIRHAKDGTTTVQMHTTAEYQDLAGRYFAAKPFFEREIGRHVERFNALTHVFTAYESTTDREHLKPFERGVNSLELLDDGKRWWIVSIAWDSADDAHPIPPELLGPH